MSLKLVFSAVLIVLLSNGSVLAAQASKNQVSTIEKELANCSDLDGAEIFIPDNGSDPIITCNKVSPKPTPLQYVDITYLVGHTFHRCEVNKARLCLKDVRYYSDSQDIIVNFEYVRKIKRYENLKSELKYEYTESLLEQMMNIMLVSFNPSVAAKYGLTDTFNINFKPYDPNKIIIGITTHHGMMRYVGYAAPSKDFGLYRHLLEANISASPYQLYRDFCQYSTKTCETTVEYIVNDE